MPVWGLLRRAVIEHSTHEEPRSLSIDVEPYKLKAGVLKCTPVCGKSPVLYLQSLRRLHTTCKLTCELVLWIPKKAKKLFQATWYWLPEEPLCPRTILLAGAAENPWANNVDTIVFTLEAWKGMGWDGKAAHGWSVTGVCSGCRGKCSLLLWRSRINQLDKGR